MQPKKPVAKPANNVVDNIKKLEQQREDRRRQFEELKAEKRDKKAANEAAGKVCDFDYDEMIQEQR